MSERLPNTVEKRLNPNELISQVAQSFLANNIKYNSISTEGERKASAANVPSIINGGKLTLVESKQDGKVTIYGGAGDDTVNSSVYGFINNEGPSINELEIYGGKGKDNIEGSNAKRNYIVGGVGDDTIIGGESNDTLFGCKDNDILYGSDGSDTITGGLGSDTFALNPSDSGVDTITDFTSGVDKIGISPQFINSLTFTAASIFSNGKEIARLTNGATVSAADIVEFNVNQKSAQALPYPTDSLNHQVPKNLELIYPDENRSIFDDGERSASGIQLGTPNNDNLTANPGDTLNGGAGNDTLFGTANTSDTIRGGKDNDLIKTSDDPGPGDFIFGDAGDDTLVSGSGTGLGDVVRGGKGNDTFFSSNGGDTLTGDADANTYVIKIPRTLGKPVVIEGSSRDNIILYASLQIPSGSIAKPVLEGNQLYLELDGKFNTGNPWALVSGVLASNITVVFAQNNVVGKFDLL